MGISGRILPSCLASTENIYVFDHFKCISIEYKLCNCLDKLRGLQRQIISTQAECTTGYSFAWTFCPHSLVINMVVWLRLKESCYWVPLYEHHKPSYIIGFGFSDYSSLVTLMKMSLLKGPYKVGIGAWCQGANQTITYAQMWPSYVGRLWW